MTLEPIPVVFVTATGGVRGAKVAFERLERGLPSLSGRRFYGVLAPDGGYRACMARTAADDPAAMGWETGEIPGGRYARTRIMDWPERLPEIGPAFEALAAVHPADPGRPSVEFYRSARELVLLLPILPPAGIRTPVAPARARP